MNDAHATSGSLLHISDSAVAIIDAAWPDILEEIAEGGIIKKIAPKYGTSIHRLRAYRAQNPKAAQEWDDAWNASADAFFDRVLQIVEDLEAKGEDVQIKDAKAAAQQLKALYWLASKRNPRVYGDHKTLDVNMAFADMTTIIQDAARRRDAARAEIMSERQNRSITIDAEVV